MNNIKIAKKIAHISNKYRNKHQADKDTFSELTASMLHDFSTIVILSSFHVIMGKDLLNAINASKRIEVYIKEIKAKPELAQYAKKYSNFFDKVIERKDALLEILRNVNQMDKPFEVGTAEVLLEFFEWIPYDVNRTYNYLKENLSKGSQNGHQKDLLESNEIDLIKKLKEANDLNIAVSQFTTSPEYEQDLKDIQMKINKLNDEVTLQVVQYCNELEKLDTELHNESKIISSHLRQELNSYRTEQKEVNDEDIENDL